MRHLVLTGMASALACALAGCATQAPRPHGPGHRPAHGPDHGRGQLFVSPMGEPFRGSRPGAPQENWFAGADGDGDGRITEAEFQRDATRFFAVLDRARDGEIDPDDIAYYENVLVPEIRVGAGGRRPSGEGRGSRSGRGGPGGSHGGPGQGRGGGGGGGQGMRFGSDDTTKPATIHERLGAARFGFFDLPEPVVAADRNLNRGIDPDEFTRAAATRFAALDPNHDGAIARAELPRTGAETWRNGSDGPPALPSGQVEISPTSSAAP